MPAFEYIFPAIRGIQAGREYYVSMCPLRLIPRIFIFDEDELRPELRAQRILNKARVPEMARYILKRSKTYTFSALDGFDRRSSPFRAARSRRDRAERGSTAHFDERQVCHQRRTAPPRCDRGCAPGEPGSRRRNHLGRLLPRRGAETLPADVRGPQSLRGSTDNLAQHPLRPRATKTPRSPRRSCKRYQSSRV